MIRNKHFNAIITKFLLIITVLGLILPSVSNLMMITVVIAAVIITLTAYLVADLIALSIFGNRIAIIADSIITLVVIWEVAWFIEGVNVPPAGLVLIVLLIALGEWYYHSRYLARLLYKGRIKP
ncbi:MAG: DUF2512 family protein [Desulfotomaculaceae bacterium]|nr:DUF2512 family protein [Desulfotomaculaceae bacterium]